MKIFGGKADITIVVAVAFNVNLNMSKLNNVSILTLANVEAEANGESKPVGCPENGSGCYNGLWYPNYREAL